MEANVPVAPHELAEEAAAEAAAEAGREGTVNDADPTEGS